MRRRSRESTLMGTALFFAERSTCSRASVGVVIAREGRILVTGYNGAPAGMAHCNHSCDCGNLGKATHLEHCNSLKPCFISVHAEANALAYAARWGIPVEDSDLYSTYMPCLACAQLIITAGINRVYIRNEYRDKAGMMLLRDAKVDIIKL